MAKTKTRDDAENYWVRREAKAREKSQSDDSDKSEVVKRIFEYMFHNVTEQINAWYSKYASKEGISMSEAKKRADKLDIKAYEEKAKKYVKEKNFSQQANDEMKIYNLTMKANRLELLKSEVALELAAGNDEYEKYVEDCLKDKTIDEMERQAGILGKTIKNNGDMIKSIVNASFYNATFSERIWANQDMLRSELEGYMTKAIIQGKSTNSLISDMRKRFDVSYYAADRLLRTEERRIQTDVAKRSYEENGFGQYKYVIMNTKACDECRKLDGNIYDTKDMTPGVNAPPMHPICHCSTVPYIDRKLFDEYLGDPDSGDMTFEEWKKQKSLDTNGIEHYLRNNLPSKKSGFKDTRHVGNYISDKDLKRLSSKAASLDIRLGADKNSYGNFELYRGDVKVLENVIDTLGDQLKRAKNNHLLKQSSDIILTYDNVLGYEGDNSKVDVNAFAMTKGKTITLNKYMYDDSNHLKLEYENAVQDNLFPKGTTYKNVVIHEFGHIIDRKNPKIRQDILHVLQQDANDSNMTLEEWILKIISYYATSYSEIDNQFSELVPEVSNAHNGSEAEHVDDLLKKAGVKL